MKKSKLDKAIECIRNYCEKHACKDCKFTDEYERCMFDVCPCDWKTEKEKKKGEEK